MNKFRSRNILLSALLLVVLHSSGQTKNNLKTLADVLQNSDSIVLIKHTVTYDHAPMMLSDRDVADTSKAGLEKLKELRAKGMFLRNGKINPDIIEKSKIISANDKTKLIKILTRSTINNKKMTNCLPRPNYSIVIYKKTKQSYMDISFTCKQIYCSKDIAISESDFDSAKWSKLESFFKILEPKDIEQ